MSIGFVQIRYENAYLTLGALVFYLILKRPNFSKLFYFKSIPDFLRKAATLIVGSWLLALSQWQFFLNSDKYVERPEQTLLSPAHLKSNLYELLNALLDLINWGDQIIPPYRPLLWLILLAGLCWGILILLSRGTLNWPKIYKRGHQIFRSWREEGLTTTAAAWSALLAFFRSTIDLPVAFFRSGQSSLRSPLLFAYDLTWFSGSNTLVAKKTACSLPQHGMPSQWITALSTLSSTRPARPIHQPAHPES